jgi:CheY-like chemotaxis protein
MPTILIADDSVTVRSTLQVHLMGHGYDFVEADDGLRALRLVRLLPVDLAIVDYRMPHLDGLSLIQRIRSEATRARTIPIVLVSSDGDRALRERALALGASGFLKKPIAGGELVLLLERLLHTPPAVTSPSKTPPSLFDPRVTGPELALTQRGR